MGDAMLSGLPTLLLLLALLAPHPMSTPNGPTNTLLPNTEPLTATEPLDVRMVEGIRRYCLRELAESRANREARWQENFSSAQAHSASVAGNRNRFRSLVGAGDPRLTAAATASLEFELLTTLTRSSVVARTDGISVHAVRWPVLEGVAAEGLLLVPRTVRAAVVALPDADW
ncbi:MAG: hypothetical protein FJX77_16970, partial [Armatimonadetes bacterium]|nr:hypothetical protein [Armatimonadota bacterium]